MNIQTNELIGLHHDMADSTTSQIFHFKKVFYFISCIKLDKQQEFHLILLLSLELIAEVISLNLSFLRIHMMNSRSLS